MLLLKKDEYTGEYLYKNKWYDHYPAEEIDKDEAAREDAYEEYKENKHGIHNDKL